MAIQAVPDAPETAGFDRDKADELVSELMGLQFNYSPSIADVKRARELRDACVALGIRSGLTGDAATLVTVEEAWEEVIGHFLGSEEWTAITLPVEETMTLFEVDKRG